MAAKIWILILVLFLVVHAKHHPGAASSADMKSSKNRKRMSAPKEAETHQFDGKSAKNQRRNMAGDDKKGGDDADAEEKPKEEAAPEDDKKEEAGDDKKEEEGGGDDKPKKDFKQWMDPSDPNDPKMLEKKEHDDKVKAKKDEMKRLRIEKMNAPKDMTLLSHWGHIIHALYDKEDDAYYMMNVNGLKYKIAITNDKAVVLDADSFPKMEVNNIVKELTDDEKDKFPKSEGAFKIKPENRKSSNFFISSGACNEKKGCDVITDIVKCKKASKRLKLDHLPFMVQEKDPDHPTGQKFAAEMADFVYDPNPAVENGPVEKTDDLKESPPQNVRRRMVDSKTYFKSRRQMGDEEASPEGGAEGGENDEFGGNDNEDEYMCAVGFYPEGQDIGMGVFFANDLVSMNNEQRLTNLLCECDSEDFYDLNVYPGNDVCADHENCKEVVNPIWCAGAAYSLGAPSGTEKPYDIRLWTEGFSDSIPYGCSKNKATRTLYFRKTTKSRASADFVAKSNKLDIICKCDKDVYKFPKVQPPFPRAPPGFWNWFSMMYEDHRLKVEYEFFVYAKNTLIGQAAPNQQLGDTIWANTGPLDEPKKLKEQQLTGDNAQGVHELENFLTEVLRRGDQSDVDTDTQSSGKSVGVQSKSDEADAKAEEAGEKEAGEEEAGKDAGEEQKPGEE